MCFFLTLSFPFLVTQIYLFARRTSEPQIGFDTLQALDGSVISMSDALKVLAE